MPRLLHVLSHLDHDGAATQVRLLGSAAIARGDAVAVASLRRPGVVGGALRELGVPVTWLRQRFGIDPFAAHTLRRLVHKWKPDAVQSWDSRSAAFCSRAAVPWVHTLRESQVLPRGLQYAAGVIAADESLAERARSVGVDGSLITVVPNAFDSRIEPHEAAAKQRARGRLRATGVGVGETTPLIVCVSRIDDPQRVKEIAWASDLVRVVCPGLRLLIVGDGPGRIACERFAAAATEPGTVVWLGSQNSLADCLAAADVIWCPNSSSATPTPAVEAMAAGKPLVLAEGPGRESLLPASAEAGLPCCCVPWNDRAAWARITRRLLDDPGLAERLGRRNARYVQANHRLEEVAVTHAGVISRAIETAAIATP